MIPQKEWIKNPKFQTQTGGEVGILFGKPMPNAHELESALIGAFMLDNTAYYTVNAALPIVVQDFYDLKHQKIIQAIQELAAKSNPIDLLTVAQQLQKNGHLEEVPAYYLVECTNKVASAANAEYHHKILAQKRIARTIIELSSAAIRAAYDDTEDIFDVTQDLAANTSQLTNTLSNQATNSLVLINNVRDMILGKANQAPKFTPTNIAELDDIAKGIHEDDFVVVGGASGSGKTALMCQLAYEFLKAGKAAVLFSLEMTEQKLFLRIVSGATRVPLKSIENHSAENPLLEQSDIVLISAVLDYLESIAHLIIIYDASSFEADIIRAKCLYEKNRLGDLLGVVLVDYMQIIPTPQRHKTPNDAQIYTVNMLRRTCKQMKNTPFVVLSQYTKIGQRKPINDDLYGAQALIAAGTLIVHCYRPEIWGAMEFEDGESCIKKGELIIGKNREGRLGTARVQYFGECYLWASMSDSIYQQFTPTTNTPF